VARLLSHGEQLRNDALVYGLLRPLLFTLDPERAHALSLQLLRIAGAAPPLRAALRTLLAGPHGRPVEAFGLTFPNPVGLAAGYDKDALAWRGLGCMGFGHVEIGTVTRRPQDGNPRPRLFRLPDERALINRLGFPSRGADFVAERLHGRGDTGPVIGVNIGKQRDTPLDRAADDYESLISRFAPLADYLAVNVSSPNTPELRRLQDAGRLEPLLRRLVTRRDETRAALERPLPLLVKLSPDLSERELDEALRAILDAGIDGVIATNTTTAREGVTSPLAREDGGLSGAALSDRSTEVVRGIHERAGAGLPIVACGGIMGPADARAKLDAGATLVQLYTGLVYEGPRLVRRILREL